MTPVAGNGNRNFRRPFSRPASLVGAGCIGGGHRSGALRCRGDGRRVERPIGLVARDGVVSVHYWLTAAGIGCIRAFSTPFCRSPQSAFGPLSDKLSHGDSGTKAAPPAQDTSHRSRLGYTRRKCPASRRATVTIPGTAAQASDFNSAILWRRRCCTALTAMHYLPR